MRKLTDEEIQKIVEDSRLQQNSTDRTEKDLEDIRMYNLLFNELESQVPDSLPHDFADTVVDKIYSKKVLKDALKHYCFISFLVLLFLGVMIGVLAYAEVSYVDNILTIMNKFKGTIIFGLIILSLIQLFDQILVKNRLARFKS